MPGHTPKEKAKKKGNKATAPKPKQKAAPKPKKQKVAFGRTKMPDKKKKTGRA